jgi:hypothetical protein
MTEGAPLYRGKGMLDDGSSQAHRICGSSAIRSSQRVSNMCCDTRRAEDAAQRCFRGYPPQSFTLAK